MTSAGGRARAFMLESIKARKLADLYSSVPNAPPSRQTIRALLRAQKKAAARKPPSKNRKQRKAL